ncbi:hypothetical protein IJZ97_01865 [bacterium]|nr:hypothetical protein [bacterium]
MCSLKVQPVLSHNGLSVSFPSLQTPCPIVEGDRARRQQSAMTVNFPSMQVPCPIVEGDRQRRSAMTQVSPTLQIPCPIVEGDRQRRQQYSHCKLPNAYGNYTVVDPQKVDAFVKQGEKALPYISDILEHSNNEAQVTETLYILDRMIDGGTKGVDKMYPVLSRFNDTKSPNVQTFLAGIYRKTQVPDAFGPLVKMLVQNSINPNPTPYFDPNEEIGGAILSYLSDRYKGKTGEFTALA